MLGYVRIDKGELKVREYDTYMGYYCGVCKSIGARYGQLPRMVLSFDAAFLALILSSLDEKTDQLSQEHCIVHHIQKKPVIRNAAIDYAADVMLILAWYKLADDVQDEGKLSAKATMTAFRRVHRKLYGRYPALCDDMERLLSQLTALENEKCASLDQVADCFSQIMRIIFEDGVRRLYGQEHPGITLLGDIGYHLGKWIYLADAIDDLEENRSDGTYNPLFYRFQIGADETIPDFKERILGDLRFNMFQYLAVIAGSLDGLDMSKHRGIIDNIVYFGLNHQTRILLFGPDATTKTDIGGADDESI